MKIQHLILTLLVAVGLSACGCPRNGTNGVNGAVGAQGPSGVDGVGCVVTSVAASPDAPNGGSLISCASSSSLVLNGTNGTNGTNGSNGAAGTPGTVIQSIQLCPGTTVYPSKFIEVVFCMNNKLYGVYSANDGFLSELPPGTYGSNGINASCSFVIGANCTISN